MFVSMWISNTAAAAMMCPIVEATLAELEAQGIVEVYEKKDPEAADEESDFAQRRPTKNTVCNFLSISYAASIGGMGCIIGSGTNLTFKGKQELSSSSTFSINYWT